jgi:hypothetical protein
MASACQQPLNGWKVTFDNVENKAGVIYLVPSFQGGPTRGGEHFCREKLKAKAAPSGTRPCNEKSKPTPSSTARGEETTYIEYQFSGERLSTGKTTSISTYCSKCCRHHQGGGIGICYWC